MSPADRPADPAEELAARRAWKGAAPGNGVVTPDLAAFCQSGVSVVMASADGDGRPVVGRGLGCRIDATGWMRIVLRRSSNGLLLEALSRGAGFAATFTQPSTHRSIQVKAPGAREAAAAAADIAAALEQAAGLERELAGDGFSEALAAAYTACEPSDLTALDFAPERAFVQTPGPSAGSALQP